jgi:Zn-finger nucleic acid-binding protein
MKPLSCPRDDNALSPFHAEGVQMAHCASCQGLWLDGASLQSIMATRGVRRVANAGNVGHTYVAHRDTPECPHCTGTIPQLMQPVRRVGAEIDVCPKCLGSWLDQGEFERAFPGYSGTVGDTLRRAELVKGAVTAAAIGTAAIGATALAASPPSDDPNRSSNLSDILDVGEIVWDVGSGALDILGSILGSIDF